MIKQSIRKGALVRDDKFNHVGTVVRVSKKYIFVDSEIGRDRMCIQVGYKVENRALLRRISKREFDKILRERGVSGGSLQTNTRRRARVRRVSDATNGDTPTDTVSETGQLGLGAM